MTRNNPAGYKGDGSRCTCPCHNPKSSLMHIQPCCSPNPPWVDIPMDRDSFFAGMAPWMILSEHYDLHGLSVELHFTQEAVEMLNDSFLHAKDDPPLELDKLYGFNVELAPTQTGEPLLYIVCGGNRGRSVNFIYRLVPYTETKAKDFEASLKSFDQYKGTLFEALKVPPGFGSPVSVETKAEIEKKESN